LVASLGPLSRRRPAAAVARTVILALTVLVVLYLAMLAAWPWLDQRLPPWLAWFGAPDSLLSIVVAAGLIAVTAVLSYRAHNARRGGGVPIAVIVGLTATTVVLALSSLIRCGDGNHPILVTPLMWTAELVKGGIDDRLLSGHLCPATTPIGLDVARLTALAAIFISLASVAITLLQAQLDRIRIRFDRSITAVVGVDDDALSMVAAVISRLENHARLVVVAPDLDAQRVRELRDAGARVISADLDLPDTLAALPLWPRLEKLYLLSADPAANLQRLATISARMATVGNIRRRLPLIVRIDDPWQAESWRARQFGGTDTQWVADAVGKYEVTAIRLLDRIIEARQVTTIIVCGTSPLMLALCAELVRRRLESEYYSRPGDPPVPRLTIVDQRAEEYRLDHEFHQQQLGVTTSSDWLDAVDSRPSVASLTPLVDDAGGPVAIIITEGFSNSADADATLGTRLASRFPEVPIFAGDPAARTLQDTVPIVGQLRAYRLAMDIPSSQAQDAWERAAMLIHERYASQTDRKSPSEAPWDQLDEFYRGSNRRQVRNALWMVEHIAGHTWDRFGGFPEAPVAAAKDADPLERLRLLGFERDEALAMAEAEYKDWCRYYRDAGWHDGPVRDDARKVHDQLGGWQSVVNDPAKRSRALRSLADTLDSLRELGYRSRPVWSRYRRTGVVTAEQRDTAWTWTTTDGQAMQAGPGDWAVSDADGHSWSVRGDIFTATYEHLDGNRWQRVGEVRARPARAAETVSTLEGPSVAAAGDWVMQGADGERWPISAQRFARDYQGPLGD
jgi:hypothetical protein